LTPLDSVRGFCAPEVSAVLCGRSLAVRGVLGGPLPWHKKKKKAKTREEGKKNLGFSHPRPSLCVLSAGALWSVWL